MGPRLKQKTLPAAKCVTLVAVKAREDVVLKLSLLITDSYF